MPDTTQLNTNKAASKRMSLSERLTDVNNMRNGITDRDTIEAILMDLCNTPLEDVLSKTDYRKIRDDISFFENRFNIFFKNHKVRFKDLVCITSLRMDDDLADDDYFFSKGVTREDDIRTCSLYTLYNFFLMVVYYKFTSGKMNETMENFMQINYIAFYEYFVEKYGFYSKGRYDEIIESHPVPDSMTMAKVLSEMRFKTNKMWRPCDSVKEFTREIRNGYFLVDSILFAPFKLFVENRFIPEECDMFSYLMRVSYQKE
jgi:hypothetical protein